MPIRVLSALLPILLLVACSAPVKEQEQTGFISDYLRLEKTDDKHYHYVNKELANYDRFIIDPVTMLYQQDPENIRFTDEELEDLKQFFRDELSAALTEGDNGYEVVSKPGPGVARFRPAITAVDDTVGALNVTIYTKISGAGLGGVAVEIETVDSQTAEQLAASIRWGSGSRILRAGFTKTGDAKILIKRWVKDVRKELDELHGRST